MKNRTKKIIKWSSIVLFGVIFFTIVMTFLGVNLPWTAFRASAIKVPEGYYSNLEWFEEYVKKEYTESQMEEHMRNIIRLSEKFGFTLYTTAISGGEYVIVSIDEEKLALTRGVLNCYAKWNNVSVFYYVGGNVDDCLERE